MKKKIKDLTLEEVNMICYKNPVCSSCPLLRVDNKSANWGCYRDVAIDLTAYNLEKEVEVDEKML